MKKRLFLFMIMLMVGIPFIKNGHLELSSISSANAQSYGDEYNYDEYDDYFDDYFGDGDVDISAQIAMDDLAASNPGTVQMTTTGTNTSFDNFVQGIGIILPGVTVTATYTGGNTTYDFDYGAYVNDFYDLLNSYNYYNYISNSMPDPGNPGAPPPQQQPPPPLTPPPTDPCSQAAKNAAAAAKSIANSSNSTVSNGLNSLQSNAGTSTNNESGMGFYKNTTTGEVTGDTPTSPPGSTPTSTSIHLSPPAGTVPVAIGHDHSGGWAQSPGDIYGLAQANNDYSSVQTSFVVGPDGQRYALVVADPNAFKSFTSKYPKADYLGSDGNFKAGTSLANDYNAVYSNITLSFSGSNLSADEIKIQAHNAAMGYVLSSRTTGLALYEKDGNEYKVIKTVKENNGSGDTFDRRPCF